MARSLSKNRMVNSAKLDFAREMRKNPSEPEALLWEALRRSALQGWKFRRQQLMYGYIADFYCEEGNLCVEVDGASHERPDQAAWDKARDHVAAVKGIKVLRVANAEVLSDLPSVLTKILEILGGPCPSRSSRRNGPAND